MEVKQCRQHESVENLHSELDATCLFVTSCEVRTGTMKRSCRSPERSRCKLCLTVYLLRLSCGQFVTTPRGCMDASFGVATDYKIVESSGSIILDDKTLVEVRDS